MGQDVRHNGDTVDSFWTQFLVIVGPVTNRVLMDPSKIPLALVVLGAGSDSARQCKAPAGSWGFYFMMPKRKSPALEPGYFLLIISLIDNARSPHRKACIDNASTIRRIAPVS